MIIPVGRVENADQLAYLLRCKVGSLLSFLLRASVFGLSLNQRLYEICGGKILEEG